MAGARIPLKQEKLPIIPEFKDQLQSLAYKLFYNFSYKVFSSIVSGNDSKILRDFGHNESIVVSKPDKGKGVVIVDKVR